MRDYKQETRDYIEDKMDILDDFASGEYSSLDHLAEFLICTIEVDYSPEWTDEQLEAEADRQRIEIYNVLMTEYAETIRKGLLMNQILEAFWNDKSLLGFYNNNIWDVYGDLLEIFDNIEDLERINKNLGGKEVKTPC